MVKATAGSKRDSRRYGVASLIFGVCAFGLIPISIGFSILFLVTVRPMDEWRIWLFSAIGVTLGLLEIIAAILAVAFAIIGKRRLRPDSHKHDRAFMTAGLSLGIVFLSLILVSMVGAGIQYVFQGTTRSTGWKTKALTDRMTIEYREVSLIGAANLDLIKMVLPGSGWLLSGDGDVYRYSRGKWRKVKGVPSGIDIQSISPVSENDVWFAGTEDVKRNYPREYRFWILHFDGTKFEKSGGWSVDANTSSIAMVGRNEGWAAYSSGLQLHYNGKEWTQEQQIGDNATRCLLFKDAEEGWALGHDVLHYQNKEWTLEAGPNYGNYDQMLMAEDGSIMLGAGTAMSVTKGGTTHNLSSLAVVKDGDIVDVNGFEDMLIRGMDRGPDGSIFLVGEASERETSLEHGSKIMLCQNGHKAPTEVSLPLYLTSISFDSKYHGWISSGEGTLIEFRLKMKK